MATPIANPVIVLGLDSTQLLRGLSGAVSTATTMGRNISSALSGSFSSVGKSLSESISAPFKGMAILNQAMEFGAKVKRIFGAPIQSAMAQDQRQAQFAGNGSIDIATSSTFTGVLGRFQNQVEDTFADIANSLDQVFDIKGMIEYARGAIAGIGALFKGWANELTGGAVKPKDLSESFKAGAMAIIDAFEVAGKIAVQIYNVFVRILNALDAKAKILGAQDVIAGGLAGAGEFLGILPRGVARALEEDRRRGDAARRAAQFALADENKITNIANAARAGVRAGNGANNLERQALEWRDRIGGLKPIDVQSRIAPFLGSGTAQLEEALVKARLQAEGGDIQQRIEAAMREQIEIEKGQVNVLNAIKTVIQNKPGFLNVVGG
jgi:hypothetical protein